jgi:hypothetical protein
MLMLMYALYVANLYNIVQNAPTQQLVMYVKLDISQIAKPTNVSLAVQSLNALLAQHQNNNAKDVKQATIYLLELVQVAIGDALHVVDH